VSGGVGLWRRGSAKRRHDGGDGNHHDVSDVEVVEAMPPSEDASIGSCL